LDISVIEKSENPKADIKKTEIDLALKLFSIMIKQNIISKKVINIGFVKNIS
jgi:hypothetical protein